MHLTAKCKSRALRCASTTFPFRRHQRYSRIGCAAPAGTITVDGVSYAVTFNRLSAPETVARIAIPGPGGTQLCPRRCGRVMGLNATTYSRVSVSGEPSSASPWYTEPRRQYCRDRHRYKKSLSLRRVVLLQEPRPSFHTTLQKMWRTTLRAYPCWH